MSDCSRLAGVGFDELAAQSDGDPTGPEIALVLVGVILAIASAVTTNLVLAARGRRLESLNEEIEGLQQKVQRARVDLVSSIDQWSFGRVLMGLIETGQPREIAFMSYYNSAIRHYLQSGLTAAGLLFDTDSAQHDKQIAELKRVHLIAAEQGPAGMQPLVDAVEQVRLKLIEFNNMNVESLEAQLRTRGEHERKSDIVRNLGTSLQILGLMAVAAKDIL
jgi:hypothetical protein